MASQQHRAAHALPPTRDAVTTNRRRWRAAATVTAVACGAAATLIAGNAIAGERPGGRPSGRPAAPSILTPPGDVRPVARYRVQTGDQIYACTGGVFALKAPKATLVSGRRSIDHFAGPSWQSTADGSLITAAKLAESPVQGAIPELLLQVKTHSGDPNGELAKVTFIQRLRTSGGLAPTGACTEGTEQPVSYRADYVFFAPR